MGYNPAKKKRSIWDTIQDVAGTVVDKVVPGDQSNWRSATTRQNEDAQQVYDNNEQAAAQSQGVQNFTQPNRVRVTAAPQQPALNVAAPRSDLFKLRVEDNGPAITPEEAKPPALVGTIVKQKPTQGVIVKQAKPKSNWNKFTSGVGQIDDKVVSGGKAVGKGVTEAYTYLGEGIGEAIAYDTKDSKEARRSQVALQDSQAQVIANAGKKLRDPNVSPEEKARWKRLLDSTSQQADETYKKINERNDEIMAKTDPVKGAASVASVGFDVATLGVGTAGVQGAKTALKEGGKKQLVKELIKQGAKTGATAAPSGALSPVIQAGSDVKKEDIAKGGAAGFAVGSVIPTGTFGVNRAGAKVIEKIPGTDKVANFIDKATQNYKDGKTAKVLNKEYGADAETPFTREGVARARELNAKQTETPQPTLPTLAPYVKTPVGVETPVETAQRLATEDKAAEIINNIRPADGAVRVMNEPTPTVKVTNGLGIDPNADLTAQARARFGNNSPESVAPETRVPTEQVSERARAEQINQVANMPDDDFVRQIVNDLGIEEPAARSMLAKSNKPALFNILYSRKEAIRGANNPTGYSMKIVNDSNAAGQAALRQNAPPTVKGSADVPDPTPVIDPIKGNVPVARDTDVPIKTEPINPAKPIEAQVDLPEPIKEVVDTVPVRPANVSAVTGEVMPLDRQIRELPDHNTAGIEAVPYARSFLENVKAGTQALKQWVEDQGYDAKKWQAEVYAKDRGGPDLSPESRAIQDQVNKIMLAFGENSKTKFDLKTDYLPEQRVRTDRVDENVGYGFVDKVNQNFGFANRRTGAIGVDELDDPFKAIDDYAEQWTYDKYGTQLEAEKYVGVVDDPVAYVRGQETISKVLAAKADKGVEDSLKRAASVDPDYDSSMINVDPTKEKAVDLLRDNYKASGGKDQFTVTNNTRIGKFAQTSRNILKGLTMDDGSSVYDTWGFHRAENANAVGNSVYLQVVKDGIDTSTDAGREALRSKMQQAFSGKLVDKDTEARMIDGAYKRVLKEIKENVDDGLDPIPSSVHFERVERDLAAEQIRYFAERTDIPEKGAKNVINRFTELELSNGRRRVSVAEKLANKITTVFHLGALGLNPYSAAQNVTESARVVGMVGPKITAQAVKDLAPGGSINAKQIRHQYGVRENVIEDVNLAPSESKRIKMQNGERSIAGKGSDAMMFAFNKSEGAKDALMLRALEIKGTQAGKTGIDLTNYVRDEFNTYAFKYGEYGSIWATKNPLGRLAFQFGQYPMKDWGLTLSKMADVSGRAGPVAQKEAAAYLAGTFGGKVAFAVPMYATFGAGLATLFGVQGYKGGPAVSIPAGIISSFKEEEARAEEAAKNGEPDSEFKWGNVWKDQQKQAAILVPGGNYLLNKVGVQNLLPEDSKIPGTNISTQDVFKNDTAVTLFKDGYNQNKNGKARFAAPDNVWDSIKTVLGGAYNNSAAEEYFGKTPLDVTLPYTNKKIIKPREGLYPVDRLTNNKIKVSNDKDEIRNLIKSDQNVQREYQAITKELKSDVKTKDLATTFDQLNGRGDTKFDDAAKADLYEKNPRLLEVMSRYAKKASDNGKPVDPVLLLSGEAQADALRYFSLPTGSKDKKVMGRLDPSLKDLQTQRTDFFNKIKNPDKPVDPDAIQYPEPTGVLKEKMDKFYSFTDSKERGAYMAENPEIADQFRKIEDYVREKRADKNLPQFDRYPRTPDSLKPVMDEYNALPKDNGPLKRDGTPSSPARSAWIKANPGKFEQLTDQWGKVSLWSLQNGLSESVFEGIDPDESDIKSIQSIAKSLGMSTGSGGGYGGGGGSDKVSISKGEFGSTREMPMPKIKLTSKKVAIKKSPRQKITMKRGKTV